MFDLRDVEFRAGARTLLKGVTLRLERGCVHGVIGQNGAGKSTLLRLLARQNRAHSGSLRLEGLPVDQLSEREFARAVAYLPQATPPVDTMRVDELVGLGRYPWHGALGRVSVRDGVAVARALDRTDMTRLSGRMMATLSGGERQRAWLAMMLAQEARCLLLDEPSAALDLRYQMELLTLIRRLAADEDLCVVVVLHDINMATRVCDRLVALRDGGVLACGPVEEVAIPETLEITFGLPLQVIRDPRTGRPVIIPG